jgi:acetylornithine deacetylase/succinyl-diaminopimelate desuccinylase-like protein
MKQWVAWHLTIFLHLARTQTPLKRDVVLLATADEEDGSYKGMRWIAEHMPHWLDAEYGLSEGGGGEMIVHGKSFFPCRVAEKGACRFNIVAHGAPGHASRPHNDNAIVKLGRALDRLGSNPLPLQPTRAVRGMLEELLKDDSDKDGLLADLLRGETFDETLELAPFTPVMRNAIRAQMRNTVAPTILHPAGNRINVIPSTASASCDGRTLPHVSMDDFAREVRAVVGGGVDIEVYEFWDGSASSFDNDLFRIMKDVTRELTGAELVPYMATGASDARFAEPLGVKVYGFGLMRNEPQANPSELMHAHDERISLANIDLGLRALYEAVIRITV